MLEKLKKHNIFFIISMAALILLGLYLRGRYYLSNPPLWYDEAMYNISLLSNKSIFHLFIELKSGQLAPPLFSVLAFFMIKIFGLNELVLRFIPFLSGILSLFAFAFLINKTIRNKFAIIFGMFLFAANIPLVYYSGEFKCYSTDVLICILLLIAYNNINFKELTNKKVILYSFIAMSLVLFSFPTMFVIPAMVISKFIEEKKITYKALWIIFGVVISCGFMYYVNYQDIYQFMQNYWKAKSYCFLDLNVTSFNNMVNSFFEFWTQEQSPRAKFNIFFVIAGLIRFFIEKRKEAVFYSLIFLFVIIASLLRIYPCADRLILFLVPVIILLISSVFDFSNKKAFSIISSVIVCFFMLYTMQMRFLPYHLSPLNLPSVKYYYNNNIEIKNIPYILMKSYKEGEQVLSSGEFYTFFEDYAKLQGINLKNNFLYYDFDITESETEQIFKTFLEHNKNSNLWIIGEDLSINSPCPNSDFIEDVLEKKNLKYLEYIERENYLFYIYK